MVKGVGVIAEPEVTEYTLEENDKFYILASDGVWEFISSQEAVDVVSKHISKGAEAACQILIETATAKWREEEGDYRDDVSSNFEPNHPDLFVIMCFRSAFMYRLLLLLLCCLYLVKLLSRLAYRLRCPHLGPGKSMVVI